jgi:spore coat protein U-like protein
MRALVAVVLSAAAAPSLAAVTCTISAPALAFGAYDVFAGTLITSTTVISVTCTLTGAVNTTVPYTVSLSTGSSATYVQRTMKSGLNTLGYNLYTTVGRTTVWGDGTGATATVGGSLSLTTGTRSRTGTSTVFGAVPALQDSKVGVYADNITMTVTY